jgi:hypothetical protein
MARKEGDTASLAQRRARRRQHSAGVGEGGRGRAVGLGGSKGRVGRLAVGPIGPEAKKESFRNKNWIFEFIKTLEICTRRFRRNFNPRIFPKFF